MYETKLLVFWICIDLLTFGLRESKYSNQLTLALCLFEFSFLLNIFLLRI